jgi:hypothetical protein
MGRRRQPPQRNARPSATTAEGEPSPRRGCRPGDRNHDRDEALMPTTKPRQTANRQSQTRRRPEPRRLDALRRPPVAPRSKRGRRGKQQTGLVATLTGALQSGRSGGAKRSGKGGVLAALGAAGAAAAIAKRRSKQRVEPAPAPAPVPPPDAT